jgi:septal ring factor EnvC (AmiA/AmiB activator)
VHTFHLVDVLIHLIYAYIPYIHIAQVGRLHGLLAAVEKSIRTMRSQSVEERERLRGEQTRLDLLQAQVKAEAEAARSSVSSDRRRLHDQRLRFDAECRAAEVRLSKRREALEVEKKALEEEADAAKEMHEVLPHSPSLHTTAFPPPCMYSALPPAV